MVNALKVTLQPSFSVNNGSIPLQIVGDPGFYTGTDIHLLLLPGVAATIRANVGSVRTGAVKPVDVSGGAVQFSGSNTAQLPALPMFGAPPTINVMFAFDLKGVPISVGVTCDPSDGKLTASAPCYAAVAYGAYKTSGLELIYTSSVDIVGIDGSAISTFGVVAAFYPPNNITTYQVQPPHSDFGEAGVELYRITSAAVTTPAGEFESPPGFPSTGTYPGKAFVLDIATYLQTERVHEIGYIDGVTGATRVWSPHIPVLEPYVGDTGYKIKTNCKVVTLDPKKYPSDLLSKAKSFIASRGLGCKP